MCSDGRLNWYRSPLPRDTLRSLTARSDLRGAACVLLHFALLAATGAVVAASAFAGNWLVFVPALIVHGSFFSFLGYAGLGHELSHHTVFAHRAPNDILMALVSFLTWNNPHYFRKSHALHHQFTVHDDIDGEVKLPQEPVLAHWPLLLLFDVPMFRRALKITGENARNVVNGEFGQRLFPEGSADRTRLVSWARIMLAGHALLAAAFLLSDWWPLLFAVSLAPFFGTLLNRVLAQAQHFGMEANSTDHRKSCRTVLLNPFLAFLYWQMNYHIEHHMYPNVPFHQLKRLNREIGRDLPPPMPGLLPLLRALRPRTTP